MSAYRKHTAEGARSPGARPRHREVSLGGWLEHPHRPRPLPRGARCVSGPCCPYWTGWRSARTKGAPDERRACGARPGGHLQAAGGARRHGDGGDGEAGEASQLETGNLARGATGSTTGGRTRWPGVTSRP